MNLFKRQTSYAPRRRSSIVKSSLREEDESQDDIENVKLTEMEKENNLIVTAGLPEMTNDRKDAFMRGVIPVYDVSLAAAYEVGVSNMGSVHEGVTREDFKTPEVCGLLSAGGELRTLGLHILYQLVQKSREKSSSSKGPSKALEVLLSVGVLPLLCSCAHKISDALLEESEDYITPLLSDMGLLSDILSLCCSEDIIPLDQSHYISTTIHFRWLASAAANMLIDAIDESSRGTAISSTELSIAVDLLSSWQWLSSRPNNISGLMEECFSHEFKEPEFLKACFLCMEWFPRSMYAEKIAYVLTIGTKFQVFCASLNVPEVNGYRKMNNMLSSTCQNEQTIIYLLSAVGNCASGSCGDNSFAKLLIENDALISLQPAVLNSNLVIAIKAAYDIACLASQAEFMEAIVQSGALNVIEEVLQMITPGTVRTKYVWERGDILCQIKLLSPDTAPSLQLACLHIIASSLHDERNVKFLQSCQEIISCIRYCVASYNAFIYMVCTNILGALDLPIPCFKARKSGAHDDPDMLSFDVPKWSIDDVCRWVGDKCFKIYRPNFRENYVSGAMLLSLTDEHLEHMKIDNLMHRMSILFEISALKEEIKGDKKDGSRIELHSKNDGDEGKEKYDIFLSYRRQGGGDFAHLLKLSLTAMGLTVFLDIDNLGSGSFDKKLLQHMLSSKNVVLVWTKGCMDRFLDGKDYSQDFVAKEYLFALKNKMNILPIYKEDFEFPNEERLPEELRPILLINALKFVSEYREASLEKIKNQLMD